MGETIRKYDMKYSKESQLIADRNLEQRIQSAIDEERKKTQSLLGKFDEMKTEFVKFKIQPFVLSVDQRVNDFNISSKIVNDSNRKQSMGNNTNLMNGNGVNKHSECNGIESVDKGTPSISNGHSLHNGISNGLSNGSNGSISNSNYNHNRRRHSNPSSPLSEVTNKWIESNS